MGYREERKRFACGKSLPFLPPLEKRQCHPERQRGISFTICHTENQGMGYEKLVQEIKLHPLGS
jgi:hypothetical protein